jgi:ATP-dependent DNA helicase DinG
LKAPYYHQAPEGAQIPESPGDLEARTLDFFAPDGPLAQRHPGYQGREGQQAMACAVARAIAARQALVVEAGTGVGKTYAYLAAALASGRRTVVSTATKALQDQLFERDLPEVTAALGMPLRAALLKGRSSYLCRHRLAQAWQRLPGHDRHLASLLGGVVTWARGTATGDLAEVPGLEDRADLVALVTSTRDNCLGARCPEFEGCHLHRARRDALAADVVVVNHHLFFADHEVRASGMAELLPTAEVVVFDEAHRLLDTGVQFLGESLSGAQLLDLGRDAQVFGLHEARGLQDWPGLAQGLAQAVEAYRLSLGPMPAGGGRRDWSEPVPAGADAPAWQHAHEAVALALDQLCGALDAVDGHGLELRRLGERAAELAQRWRDLADTQGDACARWIEVGSGLRLVKAPLELSRAFGQGVVGQTASDGKSWIFTSATLGSDDTLSWFCAPLGLEQLTTLRVASPFDYARQAALYVPRDLPLPGLPGHSTALARAVWPWVLRLGGRTLVLTTTLKALTSVAAELADLSERDLGPEVLAQGQAPKRELLQRFRRAGERGHGQGAVLVASASFWEGVDLAGDCLQLLVIDKLPFPPPDDPWVQARCRAIEQSGERPFARYFLPEAAVALRQGAGRLIRSEIDQGLLVVGDVRLHTMGYGRRLWTALPPMRRLETEDEVGVWLDELVTTASTRDLPWT